MRKAYEKRFESFEQMARSGDTLLFVRVVATSSELGRAYELTQAVVVLEALSVSECGLCRPFDIP